jgi:hypothetical protein
MEPTNETLLKAFGEAMPPTGGSIVVQCLCGRTHYVSEGDYEEGELEELRKKREENDERYIEHGDTDYVSTVYLNGGPNVFECPCHWEIKIARFFWAHREFATNFLKNMVGEITRQAARETLILEELGRLPSPFAIHLEPTNILKLGTVAAFKPKTPVTTETALLYIEKGIVVKTFREAAIILVWHTKLNQLYHLHIADYVVEKLIEQLSIEELLTYSSEIIRFFAKNELEVLRMNNPKMEGLLSYE